MDSFTSSGETTLELPQMTPLQALTVNVLFEREMSSRRIQEELEFLGVKMKMPLVYRMLRRLEIAEYVCGGYRRFQTFDGRLIRERHYRVSRRGLAMWEKTVAFYAAMNRPPEYFQPTTREEYLDDEFEE
jgi:hypothetical protein